MWVCDRHLFLGCSEKYEVAKQLLHPERMQFNFSDIMKRIYFKSVRKGNTCLETSMVDPVNGATLTCQTLKEILRQRAIRPNTGHHALPTRLSVSCLTPDFPGSYRPEGVLFETDQSPSYCVPFDLMALTKSETFTAQDYNSALLKGYAQFVFDDFESMVKIFPNSSHALNALNEFRRNSGLRALNRGMHYNELCFEKEIAVKPIALIGDSDEIKALSLQHRIKRYDSVGEFITAKNYPLKYLLMQAGRMLDLALPSMFDGYQGLSQERG